MPAENMTGFADRLSGDGAEAPPEMPHAAAPEPGAHVGTPGTSVLDTAAAPVDPAVVAAQAQVATEPATPTMAAPAPGASAGTPSPNVPAAPAPGAPVTPRDPAAGSPVGVDPSVGIPPVDPAAGAPVGPKDPTAGGPVWPSADPSAGTPVDPKDPSAGGPAGPVDPAAGSPVGSADPSVGTPPVDPSGGATTDPKDPSAGAPTDPKDPSGSAPTDPKDPSGSSPADPSAGSSADQGQDDPAAAHGAETTVAPVKKADGWEVDSYQLRAFSGAVMRARSYLDAVQAKVNRMQGAELTPQLGTSPVGTQLAKKFDDRLNSADGLRAMLAEAMKRMDDFVTSAEDAARAYEEQEQNVVDTLGKNVPESPVMPGR